MAGNFEEQNKKPGKVLSRLIFKFDKIFLDGTKESIRGKENKNKNRGLAYIAGNGTKGSYATCGLRYSNSEKKEYFPAEVLFLHRSKDRSF